MSPTYYRVQQYMDPKWVDQSFELHTYQEAQDELRRHWLYNTSTLHRLVKACISDISHDQRILEVLDFKGKSND